MKLIFASHNTHKAKEISAIFNGVTEISCLEDIGFFEEIIESGLTLQENAQIKAQAVYKATQLNCFADDTGLLVEYLNDEPGVFSARFAGPEKSADANNLKLLKALGQTENRKAKFQTIICLILHGEQHYFVGELHGKIGYELLGDQGFGYDPLFIPDGYQRTLAQMTLAEKNTISHRAKAFTAMLEFLKQQ
jgi:XTP/dITP diphosphohydrolase